MESLEKTLEKITAENQRAKKLRRYIVVEAVYQVSYVRCMYAFAICVFGVPPLSLNSCL